MPHVFVSYVRDNEPEVRRLVDLLRRSGVEVWFDRDALKVGRPWPEAIAEAIRDGAAYIACFSREFAARSKTYMHEELAVARELLHRHDAKDRAWCLPVLVGGGSAAESGLAEDPDFGRLHSVDFHARPDEALRHLLATVSPDRAIGRCLNSLPASVAAKALDDPLLALDFGTSNSLLAVADPELGWVPVRDPEGRVYFPTTVTFSDNWDYWVGGEAAAAVYRRPDRCVWGIKRHLARGTDVRVAHKVLDPVMLSGAVIRHMRDCAERQFGGPVRRVVIAAPAEYTSAQMTRAVRACECAGLRVERILPEPNAAALVAARWLGTRPDLLDMTAESSGAVVLVVDIGGGTTDVSVVDVAQYGGEESPDWQFEILTTHGDNELGGLDYDEALKSHVLARLRDSPGGSRLLWTQADEVRLLDQVRMAKERLAGAPSVTILLPDVQTTDGEIRTVDFELERSAAEAAVEAIDARLRETVEEAVRALDKASEPRKLDAVLLAGQGSKLWTVHRYLRQRFADCAIETGFQDSAVCRGLALQSAVLGGQIKDMLLMDATTRSIGMRYLRKVDQVRDGQSYHVHAEAARNPFTLILVAADTTIPTRRSQRFSSEGPGPLSFEVVELDRRDREVGILAVLEAPLAAGRQMLEVEVDIDPNRRMNFTLYDGQRRPLSTQQLLLSSPT